MKYFRHILADQKGAYFLMSALVLSVMVGFAALGVEIGRWYAIQAEVSKSIDGAAFAAAKNVANPLFPNPTALEAFAVQVAQANYPSSLLGSDTPVFTANLNAQGQVTVNGDVNSLNSLTTVFDTGTPTTALASVGSAQLRRAEIALVLDVSGSMAGAPLTDLQDGADLFVNNFQSFQKDHKFALLTFATGVQTPFPLDTDFVFDVTNQIAATVAAGGTNTEDALGQAVNLGWEPGQLAVPVNQRTQQVVILFSDGNPTGFRGQFKKNGADLDAVVLLHNGEPPANVWGQFGQHDVQVNYFGTLADKLGDGKSSGTACSSGDTTEWKVFDDPKYGISQYGQSPMTGYSTPYCNGTEPPGLVDYTIWVTRQMAIDHAAELKALGIIVYTIGYGAVDAGFMTTLATDPAHAFTAATSVDLTGIFQTIANELKLILVS